MCGKACAPLFETFNSLHYSCLSIVLAAGAAVSWSPETALEMLLLYVAAVCWYVQASLLPIVGGCSLSEQFVVSISCLTGRRLLNSVRKLIS